MIFRILSVLIFISFWSIGIVSAILPVDLGTAGHFAVLSGSTVTNDGHTIVNGDLGVSPGTAVTGFFTVDSGPGTVNGAIHAGDATAATAQLNLTTAYNDAQGRSTPTAVPEDIGGQTLVPGLYKFDAAASISSDVTLSGGPDDVWIFQVGSTLTTADTSKVILTGGAQASNVFWQVGSSATLGTGSSFNGTIMAQTAITLNTGTVLNGRALARDAAVTLHTNTVTKPVTISITVTGDISNWVFIPQTENSNNAITLTVTSDSSSWVITAKDALEGTKPSGSAGKLSEYNIPSSSYITDAPKIFGTPMGITGTTKDSTSKTDILALTGSDQTLETGLAPVTGQDLPLTFKQVVSYTDPHLTDGNHQYRITVVFTGITA
jgi:hypothetical protein